MRAITYSSAKKNLRALMQKVCEDSEPTIIMGSKSDEHTVLISLEDYQAMEETAYLLRSPANRKHLERSLQEMREGRLVELPSEDA